MKMENYNKSFRPALRSIWFLFFGLFLGPAIIFFQRDPEGSPLKWAALSLLFLALILHRLSLRYELSEWTFTAYSWWGRGPAESIRLADIAEVAPRQGLVGRLVGCGHLELRSLAPDEPGLNILGQRNHLALAEEIERAVSRAREGHNG